MVVWNKITKSGGKSWDKISEPAKVYQQYSLLQEDGERILQEDNHQLSTEEPEFFVEIWDRITKSTGKTWDKLSRYSYPAQYQTFSLLQEDGFKILQEDSYGFLISQLQQFYKKITKSTGIVWNKIT